MVLVQVGHSSWSLSSIQRTLSFIGFEAGGPVLHPCGPLHALHGLSSPFWKLLASKLFLSGISVIAVLVSVVLALEYSLNCPRSLHRLWHV